MTDNEGKIAHIQTVIPAAPGWELADFGHRTPREIRRKGPRLTPIIAWLFTATLDEKRRLDMD
jgi:hypothetical protein